MLTDTAFRAQFDEVERAALRLESRRHTDIESERAQFAAFLAGVLPETYARDADGWTGMLEGHFAAGRAFRRARVMDDPLTDYNRYMIYTGRASAALGEDIRYLSRAEANRLDLPDHDFWVFDSSRLLELRFTDDGRPLGHDLIVDADLAARHEQWILRALDVAMPSADYIAEDPTRAWPPIRLGALKGT